MYLVTLPSQLPLSTKEDHRTSDSNIWLLHIPAAMHGRREDTAESRGLAPHARTHSFTGQIPPHQSQFKIFPLPDPIDRD